MHHYVGKIVTVPDRRIVSDHRVVDHRRRMVVIDDGRVIDVGDPDARVVVNRVEIRLVYDNGVIEISVISDVHMNAAQGGAGHHDVTRPAPVVV